VGGVELPCGAVERFDLGDDLTVGAVEGDVAHVGRCVPLEGGFRKREGVLAGHNRDGGGEAGEEEGGKEHDCGCCLLVVLTVDGEADGGRVFWSETSGRSGGWLNISGAWR